VAPGDLLEGSTGVRSRYREADLDEDLVTAA